MDPATAPTDDEGLQALVLERAEADPELSDEAKLVVLAALESAEMVEQALDGTCRIDTDRLRDRSTGSATEPAGAFLSSVEVRGFRGIGPTTTLRLHPAPGLIVVAGRNGSGKSSLAEACELALTGDSYRWSRKRSQTSWKEYWRNLHDGGDCSIRVGLAEEGAGITTIGVDWTVDGDLAARNSWVQRPGRRREAGTDALGWRSALELFRPMLSYDEVGGLLEAEPSKLYDALAGILGLERIADAQQRLDDAVKMLEQPRKEANLLRTELKKTLADLADERADEALVQLRKHHPDIAAVERLATGGGAAPAGLAGLRGLTGLRLPDEDEVMQAAGTVRSALADVVSSSGISIDLVERRTSLLRQALELHEHHGPMPCPVCGTGTLDDEWHQRAGAEVAHEDDDLATLRAARGRLASARTRAEQLVATVDAVASPGDVTLDALPAAQEARRAWSELPADDASLADHLEDRYPPLREAMTALREEASSALAALEDAWSPVAGRLSTWAGLARQAEARDDALTTARAASQWTKSNAALLRHERLEPLVHEARAIWAALRQESSVDLGTITLEGQKNRRHVDLHAEVDGHPAGALGVMSQGELHALTLALFLPRATRPASPFRFLVLDDPIQAMDPAKVDGFVQVLGELAKTRQVVVFSHDDRLGEAIRMAAVPARVLELHREADSLVQIVDALDPARRYVDDAFALAQDSNIPADVQARVLPGLCRMALEAAARDIYLARRFTAGDDRREVEQSWQKDARTRQRLALALHDGKEAPTDAWINARSWRKAALTVSNGVHSGLRGDPVGAVKDVRDTVNDLRAGRR